MYIPEQLTKLGSTYFGFTTDVSLFYGYLFASIIIISIPFMIRNIASYSYYDSVVLNILAMLELATLLLAVGMYNFSMAFLIGSIYIPLSTFLTPKNRYL